MPGKRNSAPFRGHNVTVTRSTVKGLACWRVLSRLYSGKKKNKYFPLDQLREANDYARTQERETLLDGTSWTDSEKTAVRFWRNWTTSERIQGRNVPALLTVLQVAVRTLENRRQAATLGQGVASYLEEAAGRMKPARFALVKRTLEKFVESCPSPGTSLAEVGEDTIKNALAFMCSTSAAKSTRAHYLNIVSAMFARCMERGLCKQNPARIVLRSMGGTAPGEAQPTCLSVSDVQALLHAAAQLKNKGEALHFVIGLLTGIRMAERCRLQFQDIRLDEPRPYINLPAGKAKTMRSRQVFLHGSHAEIIKALMPQRYSPTALILSGHANEKAQKEKAICTQNQLASAAGVELPRNVLRHTAASYLCAYLESMSAAALNLGHSEAMLIKHYRALVPHSEGVRFFSLPIPEQLRSFTSRKPEKRKAAAH